MAHSNNKQACVVVGSNSDASPYQPMVIYLTDIKHAKIYCFFSAIVCFFMLNLI
jgi:hypothetical protein